MKSGQRRSPRGLVRQSVDAVLEEARHLPIARSCAGARRTPRPPPCCPVRRHSVVSCGHEAVIEHGARPGDDEPWSPRTTVARRLRPRLPADGQRRTPKGCPSMTASEDHLAMNPKLRVRRLAAVCVCRPMSHHSKPMRKGSCSEVSGDLDARRP